MWWLIPIGVVGVGLKLLYDSVSDDEFEARERWENKRIEVEKTIEEHQENIDIHLQQSQSSYDFYFLNELHYSSVKVSNVAYQLLDDSRTSFRGINKILKEAKERKKLLQSKLDKYKKEKNYNKIDEIKKELKMVNDLRRNVFDDRDKLELQKDSFLQEVQRLNHQTRELKELIRDRCGSKGEDWYFRLEDRKLNRT